MKEQGLLCHFFTRQKGGYAQKGCIPFCDNEPEAAVLKRNSRQPLKLRLFAALNDVLDHLDRDDFSCREVKACRNLIHFICNPVDFS